MLDVTRQTRVVALMFLARCSYLLRFWGPQITGTAFTVVGCTCDDASSNDRLLLNDGYSPRRTQCSEEVIILQLKWPKSSRLGAMDFFGDWSSSFRCRKEVFCYCYCSFSNSFPFVRDASFTWNGACRLCLFLVDLFVTFLCLLKSVWDRERKRNLMDEPSVIIMQHFLLVLFFFFFFFIMCIYQLF